MNKKGLTLVEVIATLVLLATIALIVTPNIYRSIQEYKTQMFETQMNIITDAAKTWATDYIKLLPSNNSFALKVDVQELQEEGYLKENLKNPRDGGTFDESSAFVLITCNYIEDETGNFAPTYNYVYNAYEDLEDYQKEMAIEYIKNNKSKTEVTVSALKQEGYISSTIKDTSDTEVIMTDNTIVVTTSETDIGIQYEAIIK